MTHLQNSSPWWLVGSGLAAGLLMGSFATHAGIGFYALLLSALRTWRLADLMVSGIAVDNG